MAKAVKHPEVEVELIGTDGNAFAVMGTVKRAMRMAGVPEQEVLKYLEEATSGDYDNLLQVTMSWVTVK